MSSADWLRPLALTMPAVTVKSSCERIADRQHPLADARLRIVAEVERREIVRVDLDDRDVGRRIAADDFRVREDALVEQRDR